MALPTTMWTQILGYRDQPDRTLDLLVRRYHRPIFEYSRGRGLQPADAEDVTQEVFLRVTRPEFLARADRSKGKFRSLLLAVTQHVIASHRRRELAGKRDRRREVPLDDFDIPERPPEAEEFDRLWLRNLLDWALLRLSHDPQVRAVQLQMEGRSYQEIAQKLGKTVSDVTNYVHRAKPKLRKEIERLIGEYSDATELPAEIAVLMRHAEA